jgi:DNA replication protein DnaC
MLTHPTLDKIERLRLAGMAKALSEQMQNNEIGSLTFEERLGLLIDRELTERENRRLTTRLRHQASIEDLDFRGTRGMDKSLVMSLSANQWISDHQNLLITGPTGVGKSYLACALGHKACRDGHMVLYQRLPRILHDLAIARHDGRYKKLMAALLRTDLLVLDDFGIVPVTQEGLRDMLEILEDRYDRRSTLVTSQVPVKRWHETLADPTMADAILDRLVHNAHKIELKGESMRKIRAVDKHKAS